MEDIKNILEVIYMNSVGKVLVAGTLLLTGYFAGFYEMKYKTMKYLLEVSSKKNDEESQK